MANTYGNLYLDLRQRLRAAGDLDPSRTARELVCFASGKTREELVRDSRLYASPTVEQEANALAERCLAGEPLAYLVGTWEFYGIPLEISRAVLIPRPDTEILAERAIEAAQAYREPRVLDLCTGSGCIGLALSRHVRNARVLLGDRDDEVLKIARANIRRNAMSGQVSVANVNALEPPPRRLGTFDMIVSNPPYIPTKEIETLDVSVRAYEPHLALDGGADGLKFYRVICSAWGDALRPGGKLLVEVGFGQADAVRELFSAGGFQEVETVRDLGGVLRVVCGTRTDS